MIKETHIIAIVQKTTRLISEKFNSIELKTTFQSRFGPQKWLEPYTDKTLEKLPSEGKKNILAICPGFSSDCVETLEEILIQGKESFLESGGENFDMVPCLNDSDDHIALLKIISSKKYIIDEYIFTFQISTFDSCNFLDGWSFISSKNFCLSLTKQ